MAKNLNTEFPANTNAPDANYPFGSGRDVTLPGDNTGTPYSELWFNDLWAFLSALLIADGRTPNDLQDTVLASQYFDAFFSIVNGPAVIKRPVNITPASGAVVAATSPTLVASEYQTLYGRAHVSSRFRVATDIGMTNVIHDSGVIGPVEQYQLVTPIAANASYFWDCQYTDEDGGFSDFSIPTDFSIPVSLVQTPLNLTPVTGDLTIGEEVTVTSDPFASVPSSVHIASQWQITTDPTFVVIDFDSGEDLSNLLSFTQGGLTIGEVQYFWRVRYKSTALGFGAYSIPTSFTTVAASVLTPVNALPLDGTIGIGPGLQLNSTAFVAIPALGETHIASQWQVSTDPSFIVTVFDSGDDSINLTSVVADGLSEGQIEYFWRVRHRGSVTGYSDYSEPTTFETLTQFADWEIWDGTKDGLLVVANADTGAVKIKPGRVSAFIGEGRYATVSIHLNDVKISVTAVNGLAVINNPATVVATGTAPPAAAVVRLADDKVMLVYNKGGNVLEGRIVDFVGNTPIIGAANAVATVIPPGAAWDIAEVDSTHVFFTNTLTSSSSECIVLIVAGEVITLGAPTALPDDFPEWGTIDVLDGKALVPYKIEAGGLNIAILKINTTTNTSLILANNTDDNQLSALANRFFAKWVDNETFVIADGANITTSFNMLLGAYDGAASITVQSHVAFAANVLVNFVAVMQLVAPNELLVLTSRGGSESADMRHLEIASQNLFFGQPVDIDASAITTAAGFDLKSVDGLTVLAVTVDAAGLRQKILNGSII